VLKLESQASQKSFLYIGDQSLTQEEKTQSTKQETKEKKDVGYGLLPSPAL